MVRTRSRPKASSPSVRRRMQATRRRDTPKEVELRKILFSEGYRYRVDHRLPELRRRGDIVFTRRRVVVFVDGCFWHGCRKHGTLPKKTNRKWWKDKIEANVSRDQDTNKRLRKMGWKVVRVWEHEDVEVAAKRILEVLDQRKT